MSIDLVAASFRAFAEAQVTIRDSDRFAIDLFNTSFLVIEPDVRLVTLVMAVEALLEPREQSRNAVKLVDSFIKTVTDCNC